MKKQLLLAAAVVASLGAAPAVSHADVAFNVGATTDYRYRGISQTRLKPALQGGVDYSAGGFYLGAWASTIKWVKDGGGKSDFELDLYGGFKGEITKGVGFDVGVLKYVYEGAKLNPHPNTTEVYGAITFGPATVKYSQTAGTNLFGFGDSNQSGYLDLSATFEVADGWTVTPHLGRQTVAKNGKFSYTDYAVTLSKDFSGLVVSAAVIGTDTKEYKSPAGRNLGRTGLVLGVKYNF